MKRTIEFIEQSFLKTMLKDEHVTDISYNGRKLFYFSNTEGRQYKDDIDSAQVMSFLRNIANFTNQKFSYIDTFLDVSVGKYRLSAMHHARGRYDFEEAASFALRINTSPNYETFFANKKIGNILEQIVRQNNSIIISGMTGVGKTTMQRYLLKLLPANTRLIVIDNVQELSDIAKINASLDVTLWQTQANDENEIADYVKKALRFHPDYIIIAESRGGEMKEIYQSALTGHPNIITIHATSIEHAYKRIGNSLNNDNSEEISRVFPTFIHLEKKQTKQNKTERFISHITQYNFSKSIIETIYKVDKK